MEKKKKTLDVQKFGGTQKVANVDIERDPYEVSTIEAQSQTKLESDTGEGIPLVIREFKFGLNPNVWKQNPPTKQQLFNYHVKGIEITLWQDGLKPYTEVEPRLVVDEKNLRYSIFITAVPSRGNILFQTPQTLKEIAST